ncbi:MAG: ABC transporter ATP-binding protein [Planctomycetota bacterium]
MIELESITKLYGTVIGVNDMSLSLGPGAYGLVGPNGSGKTTLLNLITGQLRPTMGRVRVLGYSPWNRDALLRMIGLCPAVDVYYPNVTGLEWVTYLVQLHGFGRREARRRAAASLEAVGLQAAMGRTMGTYSLGMRQRTKLAQAFAHDPTLLILDEPFNGLDPIGRHEMTEVLREWVHGGRSLILASHILHEVEAVTSSFLLIRGGRLLAFGPPEEIHGLLADMPNEIRVRCDNRPALACKLVESGLVESIRFVEADQALLISTRSPAPIFEQLPAWLEELGVHAWELNSADDSLQQLFSSLMRMHRGERS